MREHLNEIEELSDKASADFMNKRLAIHENFSWILRSTLG